MLFTCFYIFLARIVDVSLGTVRTVLIVKDKKIPASIIAFFEVFVWFLVAREALNTSVSSLLIPIFYAAGYATGTLIGSFISSKLDSLMAVTVIIKETKVKKLMQEIRDKGFGVSNIDLKNTTKEKKGLLLIQLNKKSLNNLTKIIRNMDTNAFVTINETKYCQNGLIK